MRATAGPSSSSTPDVTASRTANGSFVAPGHGWRSCTALRPAIFITRTSSPLATTPSRSTSKRSCKPAQQDPLLRGRNREPTRPRRELIANSVVAVGLLPSYGQSADGVHAAGGVAWEWPSGTKLVWNHINSDAMRPTMVQETGKAPTNLPRIGVDRHVGLAEHIEDFISGFREYATFLHPTGRQLFDGFAGLPVRKVVRPTQFYSMLMQRLIDDRIMDDGVLWSSQADFLARLSDWDSDADDSWPLQRAERNALLELNVPLFAAPTDGLERAQDRVRGLDEKEIAWQLDVIRHTIP